MEGSMLLALLHGDLRYFDIARDAMIRLTPDTRDRASRR
jgi:hypothetical protein